MGCSGHVDQTDRRSSRQHRAREAVEWRSFQEEQEKLQEEQRAVEAKQQQHQEAYRREREALAHLSWRQRKAALYRANRQKAAVRPSERQESRQLALPLIIKGAQLVRRPGRQTDRSQVNRQTGSGSS